MSGDPVFDEKEIKRQLNLPVRLDNIEEIQTGVVHTMIDLYDRKVTRDYFVGAMTQLLMLYNHGAKMWMLNNIHNAYHNGELGEQAFDVTYNGLKSMIETGQKNATMLIEDLQKCPTSRDRVS